MILKLSLNQELGGEIRTMSQAHKAALSKGCIPLVE